MSDSPYELRCSIHGHATDVRALKPVDIPEGGFVSGSRDKTLKIWKPSEDGTTFSEAHCMMGPTHYIACLCTLPPSVQYPSGLILAGSNDCAIYGFSLETSQPMLKLLGHSNTVCALTAGNFGTVVSGSWDKSARVWLGQKCVMILEGHQASVWAVAMFPDLGLTITGSADKTIRLWRSGNCERVFRGHDDCVRGLLILSPSEFLSCSNDATVRMWKTNGDCLHTFSGHTHYIYNMALLNDKGDFVTCSEDRTVKVWQNGNCIQTIKLPAQTVWTVACLKNEDFAVGGSDGSIRVFTRHKELKAPSETRNAFESEVAAVKTNPKTSIGDLKLDDVPGLEALTVPGTENGQTTMVREGESVYVYQWDSAVCNWLKVGDVFDANDNKKKIIDGKEYDFVFNIDVEDGKYLKLPYNKGENPWLVAQKFIEKHELSQLFLDQIANFIFTNTKDEKKTSSSNTDLAGLCDPFTGGSRYIPGGNENPPRLVAESPRNTYYPMHRYLRFDSANVEGLERKLIEFNDEVSADQKITPEELKDVLSLAHIPDTVTESQMETLDKVMSWPSEQVFPALDLFRLAVRSDAINEKVAEAGGSAVANYLLKYLAQNALSCNKMLAIRTFCNFFGHQTGELLLVAHYERICNISCDCIPNENKNVQTAVSTLYLNYAVALNKCLITDFELITYNSLRIFRLLSDQEAIFRMLVCIGTLMDHTGASDLIKNANIKEDLSTHAKSNMAMKVTDCAILLLEQLI